MQPGKKPGETNEKIDFLQLGMQPGTKGVTPGIKPGTATWGSTTNLESDQEETGKGGVIVDQKRNQEAGI